MRATARAAKRLLASPAGLSLAALVLWCVVTTTWAPGGLSAALTVARMIAVTIIGVFAIALVERLEVDARGIAERCIYVGGLALLALLLLEWVSGGFIGGWLRNTPTGNLTFTNRAGTILAVLAFPAVAALTKRNRGAVKALGFATASFAALLLLPMHASFVAFCLGGAAFLLVYAVGPRGFYAIVLVAGLSTLATPWIVKDVRQIEALSDSVVALPLSWQHRLVIWDFVSTKAMDRPILGHGFDAARYLGRDSGSVRLGGGGVLAGKLPLHPHNLALQLWLELGLVGVAAYIGIILGLARWLAVLEDHRMAMAMISGCFTAFICVGSISYGAWQNWWLATGWLGAVACVVVLRGPWFGTGGVDRSTRT